MSELLRAAQAAASQGSERSAAADRAAQMRAADEQSLRQRAQKRLGEYAALMTQGGVPTTPLFMEEYNQTSGNLIRPGRAFRGFSFLGDGWQIRSRSYTYDSGITYPLFVVRDTLGLHETNGLTTEAPHDRPHPARGGTYAMTTAYKTYGNDGKPMMTGTSEDYNRLIVSEEGLQLLGRSLVEYGIAG